MSSSWCRWQWWKAAGRKQSLSSWKGTHHGIKVIPWLLQALVKNLSPKNPSEQPEWMEERIYYLITKTSMDGSSRTMTNCTGSSEPVRLFTPWSDLKKRQGFQRDWGEETCWKLNNGWNMEHNIWTALIRFTLLRYTTSGDIKCVKEGYLLENDSQMG